MREDGMDGIQRALGCKAGTTVTARDKSIAPYALTEGKQYRVESVRGYPFGSDKPTNVLFLVQDDNGRWSAPPYFSFKEFDM